MIRKFTSLLLLLPLCLTADEYEDYTNEFYSVKHALGLNLGTAVEEIHFISNDLNGIFNACGEARNDPNNTMTVGAIERYAGHIQTRVGTVIGYLQLARSNLDQLEPPPFPDISECVAVLSNLVEITTAIQNSDLVTVSNLLSTVREMVNGVEPGTYATYQDLVDRVVKTFLEVHTLVDWMADVEDVFQQFYELAYERLKKPDLHIGDDLVQIWHNALANITNIVLKPQDYELSTQLYQLNHDVLVDENVRLSNEGWISAYNLAVNQRQYLCSVEMLKTLQAISNNYSSVTNDQVGWITNYLGTIQAPFFKLFNNTTHRILYGENDFFHANNFQVITNAFHVMSSYPNVQLRSVRSRYENYRQLFSNVWDRIELQLMTMNGLIYYPTTISGIDAETQMGLDEMKDQENAERQLSYSTNAILQFVEEIGINSNRLSQIWDKSKEVLSAFQLDRPNGQGYFEFAPASTFGDQSFDHVYVSYNIGFLEDVKSICHDLFKWLWYFVGAICIVKAVIVTFVSAVKAISHLVLIVSTLLS